VDEALAAAGDEVDEALAAAGDEVVTDAPVADEVTVSGLAFTLLFTKRCSLAS